MSGFCTGVRMIAVLALACTVGCTDNVRDTPPGEDRSVAIEEARADVRTVANNTLQQLYAKQPDAKRAVEGAAGYAVFAAVAWTYERSRGIEGLGQGDWKLAALLGAFLGWQGMLLAHRTSSFNSLRRCTPAALTPAM